MVALHLAAGPSLACMISRVFGKNKGGGRLRMRSCIDQVSLPFEVVVPPENMKVAS